MEALAWLAPADVSGLEPLGCALGFGWRTTYSHAERLAGAGLVERVYDRSGSVVAITRRGLRAVDVGQGDLRTGATSGFGLAHSHAMSWVAAYLTLRSRGWIGERQLMRDERWRVPVLWPRGGVGTHRPDLVSLYGQRVVAIEVELSAKAPRRLQAILAGYEDAIGRGSFDAVTYVTPDSGVAAGLERARPRAGLRDGEFNVLRFDDVRTRVRELAGARPWPGASR
jgi:hypothetical protein